MTAHAIDEVLAGTFPASDPPAWTPGVARPAPAITTRPVEGARVDVIVSRPIVSERTFARALPSLIGAAGLALLVAVAILAIGTPVALAVRALIELAAWVLATIG